MWFVSYSIFFPLLFSIFYLLVILLKDVLVNGLSPHAAGLKLTFFHTLELSMDDKNAMLP